MPTIQWDSSFSVNISEIDENHQQLILMINNLDNAMSRGKGRQIIGKTIDELVSFATSNFKLEENYFDRLKKFHAADHKKEHADFIQTVTKFKDDFGAGNTWISIKVMNFLQSWIRNHLKSADKKFGPSFNENGLNLEQKTAVCEGTPQNTTQADQGENNRPAMQWDNSFSVNVAEIDRQHQQLILMINNLDNAMSQGKGRHILGKIIDELINYTASHFATEEKYFDLFEYPHAADHKKEHADFVRTVSEFKADFDAGNAWLSVKIMNFLQTWIQNHIKRADKKYGPFFNENGLK